MEKPPLKLPDNPLINGPLKMEEYKNDMSKNSIEGLKGVYDDIGRGKDLKKINPRT